MRKIIIYVFAAVSAAILAINLYRIFMILPDEINQGMIYRIIYFHVPSIFTGFTAFFVGMIASIAYLSTKNLKYDALAASAIEVGLAFSTVVLVTGSIWGRIAWGIWWAWDARLTSMLVCWLLYAGYLMLRRAIDEPSTRARLSAVLSIFGAVNVVFVYKSIEWFRTQHPQPVLSFRDGGGMSKGMEPPIYWNWLALLLLAAILVLMRLHQENTKREIDALRRYAHSL
jgi:heme exporter protein C